MQHCPHHAQEPSFTQGCTFNQGSDNLPGFQLDLPAFRTNRSIFFICYMTKFPARRPAQSCHLLRKMEQTTAAHISSLCSWLLCILKNKASHSSPPILSQWLGSCPQALPCPWHPFSCSSPCREQLGSSLLPASPCPWAAW